MGPDELAMTLLPPLPRPCLPRCDSWRTVTPKEHRRRCDWGDQELCSLPACTAHDDAVATAYALGGSEAVDALINTTARAARCPACFVASNADHIVRVVPCYLCEEREWLWPWYRLPMRERVRGF